jgi:hypothetical protein
VLPIRETTIGIATVGQPRLRLRIRYATGMSLRQ